VEPLGTAGVETVSVLTGLAVNWAVIDFGPSRANEMGFSRPVRSPDQPLKVYPGRGVAESVTVWLLSYQVTPEGLTVPAPGGLVVVFRLC
jgi:hypothetical protein